MQSFLSRVINHIRSNHSNLSALILILPNKRAGLFAKRQIMEQTNNSTLMPQIKSIEEFVNDISDIDIIENTTLIFEFYKVYTKCVKNEDQDSFEDFSKWASILLNDFNEIDSNLLDAIDILNYINDSKRLENWQLGNKKQTILTQNYLIFFDKIKVFYSQLYDHLIDKNIGYQGISYREATKKIDSYVDKQTDKKFFFIGFNALNKAQEHIFKFFLNNELAEIYWDTDEFYFKHNQEAGKFFKKYKNSWKYYISNDFNWVENNLNSEKKIEIIGLPKNIAQIKKVGSILRQINQIKNNFQNTAIILGNENLLPVLLNSLPTEVESANITMGYSLQNTPLAHLFESIFKLLLNKSGTAGKRSFYYKDLITLLNHPSIQNIRIKDSDINLKINQLILNKKIIFIAEQEFIEILKDEIDIKYIVHELYNDCDDRIENLLNYFISIVIILHHSSSTNTVEKEFLNGFKSVFQQLIKLNNEFGYISNVKTLYSFYKKILNSENLSFQGEPLKGLQIMGMLESRVIDFDNVILTSVNEGFIPNAQNQNSFIPFDIRLEKGLPTYKEKDAIFAYHFYRLLQRAKNIFILFNTETDDFGSGEQSRFISQLEIAKDNRSLDKLNIHKILTIARLKSNPIPLKTIDKTPSIIAELKKIALNGFSPSSLGLYIRNPFDFYARKILKLNELEEVEEQIAANTFGTIIHDALEALYTPFINNFINEESIRQMKSKLDKEVYKQFKIHYSIHSINSGKNFLSFEIAKQFLLNFLNFEKSELNKGKKIKILDLEKDIECPYHIKGFDLFIKLKGKIDRVDEVDGVIRIIDYKTGKVNTNELKINDWDELTSDNKFNKSFQVLLYAYMYGKVHNLNFTDTAIQSGILSFKNLKSGFLKVNQSDISQQTMDHMTFQLDRLILELFDEKKSFTEKEIISKVY